MRTAGSLGVRGLGSGASWLVAFALAAGGVACTQPPHAAEALPPPAATRPLELAGDYSGWLGKQPWSVRILRDGRAGFVLGREREGCVQGSGTAERDGGRITLRWTERTLPATWQGLQVGADGALVRQDRWVPGGPDFIAAEKDWNAIRALVRETVSGAGGQFVVVPWESWTFLLPAADGEAFCRAVNAGEEPADSASQFHHWLVCPRGGPALPRGLPDVPAAWRAWLLPAPVEGRLAAEAGDGSWWVDLTDATGVAPGMVLNVQGSPPSGQAVTAGTAGGWLCGWLPGSGKPSAKGGPEFALQPRGGTVCGLVEQVDGQRARVRWIRGEVALQSGATVSSLMRANGATLGVELADPGRPCLDLSMAPMLPGLERQCFQWQVLILRAFLASGEEAADGAARAQQQEAREALAEIDPVDLLPACQRALTGQDFTDAERVKAVSALLAWWDKRQHHVYALGFDTDDTRHTPLASVQRLAAVARWAAWWEQTAADPTAVARYRDAVQAAARG